METKVKKNKMLQWDCSETRKMRGQEMKEKRSRGRKIFDFGNGRYQAVLFPEEVHFADANGEWHEIDNRLEKKEQNGVRFYENRENRMKVRLAAQADEKMAVSVTDSKGNRIGWGFSGAVGVGIMILPEAELPKTEDEDMRRHMVPHYEAGVQYAEIYPNIDVICKMKGVRFKDEIILKNAEAGHVFDMPLFAEGMTLRQNAAGAVLACKGDQVIFTLPPAFMKDANGNIGKVETMLLEENDQTIMRLVCDEEFLGTAAFPVVIDPMVESSENSNDIEDNYVCSLNASEVLTHTDSFLKVANGTSSNNGTCYAYVKHNALPQIDTSHTITKAYLSLGLKNSPSITVPVGVHEVTGSWSSSSITYNNRPAHNPLILDYVNIEDGTAVDTRFEFDVSNLVRKWYKNGGNNGVMLESLKGSTSSSNIITFHSSDAIHDMPIFEINYVSNSGLFDYTQYDSMSAGRAGTAHVNLHNGNLVVSRPLTETKGSRMPVCITMYYNSCRKDETGYSANVGTGWRLSCDQHLEKQTINDTTYYVMEDGDGTKHWFERSASSSSTYYDMSGLSLKMTISSSQIKIEDPQGMVTVYDTIANGGRIKSITDPLNNAMTFTYSNGLLTKITDGAGRETTFNRFASGHIAKITTPDGVASASFDYLNDQLMNVFDPGEGYAEYSYDENNLLEQIEFKPAYNHVRKGVYFEYMDSEPYRVQKMTEKGCLTAGGTAVQGAVNGYDFGDCMTTVSDLSVANGKKLIYHFNDYGNVVAVQDELGYAKYASYTDETLPNHATEVSRMQRAVVNMLPNHDFENASDTNWTTGLEGGATGTHSYATDYKRYGSRSVKMAKTNSVGAMTRSITMAVTTGQTYTFSGYVRTSGSATCFARVNAGATTIAQGEPVKSTDDWTRVVVSFKATAASVTLSFVTGAASGNVWVDCAQLEIGAVANRYNLIRNGDFTRVTSGNKPSEWTGYDANTAEDQVVSNVTGDIADVDGDARLHPTYLNNNVLQLNSNPEKTAGFYQVIPISGDADDVFTVGGWAMGYSMPIKGEERRYCMRVSFGTSSSGSWNNGANIDWNEEWTDWHYASGIAIAPCDYSYVRVDVSFQRNVNTAWFDGIVLHKEEFGKSYAYDENGNVTSATTLAGTKAYAEYDAYSNMTSYRQPGRSSSEEYTMTWGTSDTERKKRLLNSETSPEGVVTAYLQDEYGNETLARTRDGDRSMMMQTTKTYTSDGNHLESTYDERMNQTAYDYDTSSDLLYAVCYPNGQTVEYGYDGLKRNTLVASGVEANGSYNIYKNEYAYENDLLTEVRHNTTSNTSDVVFKLGYDEMQRPTTVQIGSKTLSRATYDANAGTLTSVDYENGGKVSYDYDDYRRVTKVRYDGKADDRYIYEYGADGRIGYIKDTHLLRTVWNERDLADRPAGVHIMNTADGSVIYRTKIDYDAYNNLSKLKEDVGSAEYETTFEYDSDNRTTAVKYGSDSLKVVYAYDELGRISSRKQYNGSSSTARNSAVYSYMAGTQSASGYTSTTPIVNGISQSGISYTYGYDTETGNVTSEVRSNGSYAGTTTYVYDSMGQLIRVNDPKDTTSGSSGTTWVYNYDLGGNMTNKVRYAYTTGTLGAALATVNMTYNTAWKDQLTKVGSSAITYDDIGNIATYAGWTNTWEAGRQLKKQVKDSTEIEYDYDQNGMRIRKTVSDVVTNYVLNGTQLVHLTRGSDTLHFYHDEQGRPAVVNFNGANYHYILNLQNDVVGLVDSNGTLVVEYKYNAWGVVLGKTGTMASTLGYLNPFRYRGYIYDEETGMYYLFNRYYHPELQRFISADLDISGDGEAFAHNVYAYCLNNPINRTDSTGAWSLPTWAKVAIGTAVIAAAAVLTVATAGTGTALACFAMGALQGSVAGAASGAIGGAISGAITHRVTTGSWDGALEAAIDGAATGYMSGAITGFIMGGLTSPYCFIAGTPVLTENGLMPIEEIKADQMVWAEDPETGERALKRVVRTFLNQKDELVHVQVNGETITSTTGHPFYVQGKGWVAAKDLKVNDKLELQSGKDAFVEGIWFEKLAESVNVYNFEVEDFHTYFVGERCVLVHNKCGNHGKLWRKESRSYWREQGKLYKNSVDANAYSASGKYKLTQDNINRMLRGSAPKGTDGFSVALHHNKGILVDFYDYSEILTSVHRANYRLLHPWVFK